MGLEAALVTNHRGLWVLLLFFGGMLVTLGFRFAPGAFPQWLGAFHIGHYPQSGTLLLQGLDSEDRTHPRDGGPM